MNTLISSGALILRDDAPREVITGSAAQLHRVRQSSQRFANRASFEAFDDRDHKKLDQGPGLAGALRIRTESAALQEMARAIPKAAAAARPPTRAVCKAL